MRIISLGGRYFYRIVASLLVLISVAASYYMSFYNVVIGYGIIAAVMTTDIDLSKEVIGLHFILWMLAVSALPLLLIWKNELRHTLIEQLKSPGKRLSPVLILLAVIALVWLPIRYMDRAQSVSEKFSNVDLPSYGGVVAHSYLPSNWLSALGLFAYTKYDESLDSTNLFDPGKHFTYVPPKGIDDTYVVFIIGETTRWDHMGLLGYERDTTPRLSKEKSGRLPRSLLRYLDQAFHALHVCARRRYGRQPSTYAEGAKYLCGTQGAGVYVRAVRDAERGLVL